MANYIPFVTSPSALQLVKTVYDDAEIARVSIDIIQRVTVPSALRLWIDPGVDGFDNLVARRPRPDKSRPERDRKNSWYEFMKAIPGFERIGSPSFWTKPDATITSEFVNTLLDQCAAHKPIWITVPQLPIVDDAARNKINRVLAKASGEWKSSHDFAGRLILPLIFTNQNQINGKTQRNPKVEQGRRCYHESQADGLWVVDASLTDESGSKTLRNTRLPNIIALHQELNDEIPSTIRIAGPYWGMNLVLWSRGLVDHPAIGVGSSYQYHLAGGPASQPSTRLAIDPLRRRVGIAQLGSWLEKSLKKIGPAHPAYGELKRGMAELKKVLETIQKQLPLLSDPYISRKQVARFYKGWLDLLAATPPGGRSVALFQDLSTAYALGRSLDSFASGEGTARRPESVVEPLMLNCL